MIIKRAVRTVALVLTFATWIVAAGKPVSDDFLSDTIRHKLASDAVVKGGSIDVDVKDGAVTLKGKVQETKQKVKAEKLARKINGVKSVVNSIQIEHP